MAGKVLAIANEKGGVGKTTCSVQLARELAARGKQVCIIDNDPSYDATSALFGDDIPEQIALGVKPEGYSNSVKLYAADSAFEPCEVTENLYVMGATDALSVLKGAELEPAYDFVQEGPTTIDGLNILQSISASSHREATPCSAWHFESS